MRQSIRIVAMFVVVFALGCASPRYYGARYAVDVSSSRSESPLPPSTEARDALLHATTIAFYPPDSCREVNASAGASDVANVIRLRCGVLMEELELEATRAGFHVVSWQTLRGGGWPMEYARANKVDLLFELNELSLGTPAQTVSSNAEVSFYRRSGPHSEDEPLSIEHPRAVAERCEKKLAPALSASSNVATLDVKMVSVADGRVLWSWRDVSGDQAAGGKVEPVTRTVEVAPGESPYALAWEAGLVLGLTAVVVGAVLTAAEGSDSANGGGNIVLISGAGVSLLSGVTGLLLSAFTATYAQPQDVICTDKPALEDELAAIAPTTPVDGEGPASRVSVQHAVAQGDAGDAETRAKLHAVIGKFTGQLASLRSTAPAQTPPAPTH